jgi:hypothetical protein
MTAKTAIVLCTLIAAIPGFAHHSFQSEYDLSRPVTIKGVVVRVEFLNPHARFYVDATDENGAITHWELEGAAPNALLKRPGWTRGAIKTGDQVIVSGYRAKDGSNLAAVGKFVMADGRELLSPYSWGYPGSADAPLTPGR